MTRAAFENAIRVGAAIGGSTNAVIHLLATSRAARCAAVLDDFDVLAQDIPALLNLQPNDQYLMEDFCYAGGLPRVGAGRGRTRTPKANYGDRVRDRRENVWTRRCGAIDQGHSPKPFQPGAGTAACCAATSRRTGR